jgi:hypothetical protein
VLNAKGFKKHENIKPNLVTRPSSPVTSSQASINLVTSKASIKISEANPVSHPHYNYPWERQLYGRARGANNNVRGRLLSQMYSNFTHSPELLGRGIGGSVKSSRS